MSGILPPAAVEGYDDGHSDSHSYGSDSGDDEEDDDIFVYDLPGEVLAYIESILADESDLISRRAEKERGQSRDSLPQMEGLGEMLQSLIITEDWGTETFTDRLASFKAQVEHAWAEGHPAVHDKWSGWPERNTIAGEIITILKDHFELTDKDGKPEIGDRFFAAVADTLDRAVHRRHRRFEAGGMPRNIAAADEAGSSTDAAAVAPPPTSTELQRSDSGATMGTLVMDNMHHIFSTYKARLQGYTSQSGQGDWDESALTDRNRLSPEQEQERAYIVNGLPDYIQELGGMLAVPRRPNVSNVSDFRDRFVKVLNDTADDQYPFPLPDHESIEHNLLVALAHIGFEEPADRAPGSSYQGPSPSSRAERTDTLTDLVKSRLVKAMESAQLIEQLDTVCARIRQMSSQGKLREEVVQEYLDEIRSNSMTTDFGDWHHRLTLHESWKRPGFLYRQ